MKMYISRHGVVGEIDDPSTLDKSCYGKSLFATKREALVHALEYIQNEIDFFTGERTHVINLIGENERAGLHDEVPQHTT